MLLNILNHFTSRRIICSLSAAATSRAQPNNSHLKYYYGSSTFVRVLVREQTNQTTQGGQRRETAREKFREEDRKAGLKERMKITQLLIVKRKANRVENFTCSTKILAWSAQPSKRTWLATSSTFQRMIFWRSLDTAAWLLWFMEVLSSLRNADGNPLPSGHGKEKGETCWMPLSSTRKEQYERKNEALYYFKRVKVVIHYSLVCQGYLLFEISLRFGIEASVFLSPHKKKTEWFGVEVSMFLPLPRPSPPPPSKKSMNEKKITSKPAAIQFFLLDSGSAEKVQFPHKHLLSLFLPGSV